MATIPTYPGLNPLVGNELIVVSDTNDRTKTRTASINDILALTGTGCCGLQASYNEANTITTTPDRKIVFNTTGGGKFQVTGPFTKDGSGPIEMTGDGATSFIENTPIGQSTEQPGKFTCLLYTSPSPRD